MMSLPGERHHRKLKILQNTNMMKKTKTDYSDSQENFFFETFWLEKGGIKQMA